MLKSALSSISIFQLSSHRAPKKVCRDIQSIQSSFLMWEKKGKRKIHWFDWERICQSMEDGGLGVKKVDDLNMALLFKWVWRILKGKTSLRLNVLEEK